MGEPKSRKKHSRKKRVLLLVVGVSLGIVCRMLPHEYQGPCNVVARILALIVGAPT